MRSHCIGTVHVVIMLSHCTVMLVYTHYMHACIYPLMYRYIIE